jgi:hypothetical protein
MKFQIRSNNNIIQIISFVRERGLKTKSNPKLSKEQVNSVHKQIKSKRFR